MVRRKKFESDLLEILLSVSVYLLARISVIINKTETKTKIHHTFLYLNSTHHVNSFESVLLQDMRCALFIALFGALFCYMDAGRVKRGDWDAGVDADISNDKASVTGSVGYKNDGFSAKGHYTETFGGQDSWGGNLGYNKGGFTSGVDYQGTKGYDRFGGHIGYKKDNFHVKGTGFRDNFGNWGAGASLGWRFKRSLRKV